MPKYPQQKPAPTQDENHFTLTFVSSAYGVHVCTEIALLRLSNYSQINWNWYYTHLL